MPLGKNPDGEKSKHSMSFVLEARNPTPFDLEIEDSLLIIKQNDNLIATVEIPRLAVSSGGMTRKKMEFNSALDFSKLSSFTGLLDGWTVDLEFELFPGIPFTVAVVED